MSGSQAALRNAAILILLVLICWQLLYWDVGDIALRSPAQTLSYVGTLLTGDMIWPHLWETMRAFVMALILAIFAGLAIGFTLGYNRSAAQTFEPILVAFYSIPKITLYPILLLIFGLGISAKVAFGTIHGIIPIALFTMNAVRNVRPVLIKTGKVMQLRQVDMVRSVLFPAALPEIFTGLRVGFSLTLIGTLLGEMFASQSGLGFLLMNAIGLHNIDLIMAITLLLVIFAATVSSVLLFYDRKLHKQK
ncbi:ABC transporter permease subunit [Neorhizobium sp. P12A]|uniref:ABC transporter permease n=1 Tax=Neorhizobium sp. P12A TaxID=2268027 RepID=UPI0011EEC955|nr:ABC transporter permease subunit [Neorhizobium sp. P12A]KAA0691928.1 ABC transporter permease subunit [Neorhizobium sp. P12A]